ncbi:hypothetical protein FJY93_04200, partial [Candidatus Kaiserbacteria bacterium]|nr:hypothetical protein [Candidatus Kaiserbacteria bacterium]
MQKLVRSITFIIMLALPVAASAQTTPNINDLIAQTQALIEQINILRGQQGASSGTSYVPSTTVPASAPVAGIC